MQLLLKIKYIEFEYRPKILIKKPVGCEKHFTMRLIKEFPTKNWKKKHWTTFCESCEVANLIERTVVIDFKMCCLYVVLDLPGSVETQLG